MQQIGPWLDVSEEIKQAKSMSALDAQNYIDGIRVYLLASEYPSGVVNMTVGYIAVMSGHIRQGELK